MGGNMDGHLILAGSLEDITHDLYLINEIAANWWASQGYTILQTENGKAVVGKNFRTGEDDPDALTTSWDTPQIGDDGLWFIADPAADARFADWRDYLPEGVSLRSAEGILLPQ